MANWQVGTSSPHFATLALAYASGSVTSGDTLELYDQAHDGSASLSSSKNIILVPYTNKHDGKDWTSGARIVWTYDGHIWANTHSGNITARDIIVLTAVDDSQGWDASNEVIRTGNNITCLWERCMLGPTKDDGTESAYSQVDSDSTHTFRNCLIKGFARPANAANAYGALLQSNSQACTWTLEHCTVDIKGGLRNPKNRVDTITVRGCVIKCGDNTGLRELAASSTVAFYDTITNFAKPAEVDTDSNNQWDPNSPGSPGSLFTVTTTATTDVIISALPSTYPDGEYDLVAPTGSGVNLALDNATIGVVEDDLIDTARTDGSNDDSGCFEFTGGGGTTHPIAGSITGSATASGALAVKKSMAGSITGSATATGATNVDKPLAGSVTGSASAAGATGVQKPLAGSITGSASLTGALSPKKPLGGTAAGSASLTGAASVKKPLAGSISGSASLAGAASIKKPLAGSVTGSAAATGTISVGGVVDLEGSISGSASVAGALGSKKPMAGSIAGSAAASGAASVSKALAASVTASASATCTLSVGAIQDIAGTAAGSSSVSGSLAVKKSMAGSITGSAAATLARLESGITFSTFGPSTIFEPFQLKKELQIVFAPFGPTSIIIPPTIGNVIPEPANKVYGRWVQGASATARWLPGTMVQARWLPGAEVAGIWDESVN